MLFCYIVVIIFNIATCIETTSAEKYFYLVHNKRNQLGLHLYLIASALAGMLEVEILDVGQVILSQQNWGWKIGIDGVQEMVGSQ